MAQMPPSIDVYGTEDLEKMIHAIQSGAMATHDYLNNQAASLNSLIVAHLRAEGLDGPGSFRWSSSTAEQAAKRVTGPMRRTAGDFEAAAKRIQVIGREWHRYIVQPIKQAEAERARTRRKLNV